MDAAEAIEVLTRTMVSGRCMDCGLVHTGALGVRFIDAPAGAGLEVVLCDEGFTHSLARVPFERIPLVELKGELNIHTRRERQ